MTKEEKLNRAKILCYYNKGTQLTVCAIKTGARDNIAVFEIKATVCFNVVFLKHIHVDLASCSVEDVTKHINAIVKRLYEKYFSPESIAKHKNEVKERQRKVRKKYLDDHRDVILKQNRELNYRNGNHEKYLKQRLNYRDNLELTFFDDLDYRREEALMDVCQKYDIMMEHAKLYC